MPVPSTSHAFAIFGYGHRSSWEARGAESAGAAAEKAQPQPIAEGFRGKVAIVTGGATGLGRAIALEFARLGCHVGVLLRQPARAGRHRAGAPDRDRAHVPWGRACTRAAATCAIATRSSEFVRATKAGSAGIHFLVNNAGIASDGALWRLSSEAWREVLETNVTGAFNCIRAVAPIFRHPALRQDRERQRPPGGAARASGCANYAASKAALLGLTRAAAVELGPGQRQRERRRARVHPHRTHDDAARRK